MVVKTDASFFGLTISFCVACDAKEKRVITLHYQALAHYYYLDLSMRSRDVGERPGELFYFVVNLHKTPESHHLNVSQLSLIFEADLKISQQLYQMLQVEFDFRKFQ